MQLQGHRAWRQSTHRTATTSRRPPCPGHCSDCDSSARARRVWRALVRNRRARLGRARRGQEVEDPGRCRQRGAGRTVLVIHQSWPTHLQVAIVDPIGEAGVGHLRRVFASLPTAPHPVRHLALLAFPGSQESVVLRLPDPHPLLYLLDIPASNRGPPCHSLAALSDKVQEEVEPIAILAPFRPFVRLGHVLEVIVTITEDEAVGTPHVYPDEWRLLRLILGYAPTREAARRRCVRSFRCLGLRHGRVDHDACSHAFFEHQLIQRWLSELE
mmetsp:Transcript_60961/g.131108  ORF Transcript_60961/g.131108 Transcript_60961/m.131108 type:complete len:271 (+) Transcript_60961:367-1179(+)